MYKRNLTEAGDKFAVGYIVGQAICVMPGIPVGDHCRNFTLLVGVKFTSARWHYRIFSKGCYVKAVWIVRPMTTEHQGIISTGAKYFVEHYSLLILWDTVLGEGLAGCRDHSSPVRNQVYQYTKCTIVDTTQSLKGPKLYGLLICIPY